MTWLLLFMFCIVFLELLLLLKLVPEARTILARSGEAGRVFADASLDDDHKEAFMRRASVEMLKATGRIVLKISVIGAAMFVVYFVIIALFPARRDAILDGFTSVSAIAILTVATVGYAWVRNVVRKKL